jgi:hypothetical protein
MITDVEIRKTTGFIMHDAGAAKAPFGSEELNFNPSYQRESCYLRILNKICLNFFSHMGANSPDVFNEPN